MERSHQPSITWNSRGFTMVYRGFDYMELNSLTGYTYWVTREAANGCSYSHMYSGSASHTVEGSKHAEAFMRKVDNFYA